MSFSMARLRAGFSLLSSQAEKLTSEREESKYVFSAAAGVNIFILRFSQSVSLVPDIEPPKRE